MADLRRIIEIYLDVENNARKAMVSSVLSEPPTLNLYRGTQVLFRCHLMMSDSTTYYAPEADAVWLFGIDSVYTRDHADLVVSETDQFNIDGDWAEKTVVGGKICWRADLTSVSLKEELADSANFGMYCALWMCPVGGSYTLMAHWDVNVRNVAVDPITALAVEGISHPTMDLYNTDMAQLKVPTEGLYRLQNGALQIKNSTTGKFQTVSLSGAEGSETMDYGPQED